jgi:hypothetical protein
MRKLLFLIFCAFCLVSKPAHADEMNSLKSEVRELTQLVKGLKNTLENQQQEIASLKSRVASPSGYVQQPQSMRSMAPAVFQSTAIQGKFNPDIGVMGDVLLKLDSPKEDAEGADRISIRELELTFGSNVDPYSRFDSTVAFSDFEEAELEEMYLTRYELPFDVTGRVGRLRPKIGKVNAFHRDSLETVDEPLVIQRYFGLEGLSKSGADLTKLLNVPSPMTHELITGVLEGGNGEDGTAFGDSRRRPTIYTHLKNFLDISDGTNLELGATHMIGSKDADSSFEVQIWGIDSTFIHYFGPNRHLKLQGEAFFMNRKESQTQVEDPDTGDITFQDLDGTVLGAYGLAHFRFHPQWSTGFRFDSVELVDNPLENPNKADIGYTGYLTFYQTEFVRWRAQVSHFDLADGRDDNQVMLQGTFIIGAHKDKLQ